MSLAEQLSLSEREALHQCLRQNREFKSALGKFLESRSADARDRMVDQKMRQPVTASDLALFENLSTRYAVESSVYAGIVAELDALVKELYG